MKKLLKKLYVVITLSCLLLCFAATICAEGEEEPDTKSVDLIYEQNENYSWSISAKPIDVANKDKVNVSIDDWNLFDGRILNIEVKSNSVEDTTTWKLIDTFGNIKTAGYKISSYTTASPSALVTWKNGTILLSTTGFKGEAQAKTVEGTFAWETSAPVSAGNYQDTLTFTAYIS